MAHATEMKYSVVILKLDHQVFVQQSRPRILIIGCSESAGGTQATQWISKTLEGINTFMKNSKAADPVTVARVTSFDEQYRRELCLALGGVLRGRSKAPSSSASSFLLLLIPKNFRF